MIIDTHLHPTNLVDEAWRHTGTPFNGERMLKLMDGPYMINGKPRRIDMGFIQPPPGNTGYRDGNRMGREGMRDYMAYCAELLSEISRSLHRQLHLQPALGSRKRRGGARIPRQGIRLQDAEAARQHAWLPARSRARLVAPGDEEMRRPRRGRADPHRRRPVHDPDACSIRSSASSRWSISSSGTSASRPAATIRSRRSGWRWTRRTSYCESGWCFQSRIVEFAKQLPTAKDRLRHGLAAERARNVAARAGSAVPGAAAGLGVSTRTSSKTISATTSRA